MREDIVDLVNIWKILASKTCLILAYITAQSSNDHSSPSALPQATPEVAIIKSDHVSLTPAFVFRQQQNMNCTTPTTKHTILF
jgi:hypothetical protein